MAIVLVNDDPIGTVYPLKTWGQLLEVIDAERAEVQDMVTAVRLDGVEAPAFRSAQALAEPLAQDAEVCIETARPADLIRNTIDDADRAATAILAAALSLGGSFRGEDTAGASRGLVDLAEGLGSLIVATKALGRAADVDLTVVGDGLVPAGELIDQMIAHIDTLLTAQRARDWARVADVIDGDIAGAVRRWPAVLNAIRQSTPRLAATAA